MARCKKWTKEEDKILVQAIKASPHNKWDAFKKASIKLEGRTIESCRNRWYYQLSNEYSKYYVGSLFTLIGHSSRLDNRTFYKESCHVTPTKSPKSLWDKIKKLLKLK